MALPTTTWTDELFPPGSTFALVTSDGEFLRTSDGLYIFALDSGSLHTDESLPATTWVDESLPATTWVDE